MSERIVRKSPRFWIVIGVVLIVCIAAAGGGIAVWYRSSALQEAQQIAVKDAQPLIQQFRRDEPLQVMVYYPYDGMLAAGFSSARRQTDAQSQAKELLLVLLKDQRSAQAALLRDLSIRGLYLDTFGTAYVDLALNRQNDVHASAWEEMLAIYAVVNTLMQNFEEIKKVFLLLDGREVQSLAGHMDLSRMFTKRMDLVKQ